MSRTRNNSRALNFTVKALDKLVRGEKRYNVLDSHTHGLGIVVFPSGSKSFFHVRKSQGTPRRTTLGAYPDMTIELARGKAAELNGKLAMWKSRDYDGDCPLDRPAQVLTFGQLIDDYLEKHVAAHAKRPERAKQDVRYTVDSYLASWKGRRLNAIRRSDVVRLHGEIGAKHKVMANRTVQLIRRIYNWAQSRDVGLYDGDNPATEIRLFHEEKRTRFIQPDEMPRLFAALKASRNDALRDFVNLSLWTGARKSDVMAMRWENVSLDDNRWQIPEPKNRRPYVVPLTPEATKILKDRWRARKSDNPWVFPSHGQTGHVVDFKGAWKNLLTAATITGVRQHDLRRTQGSWQAAHGASLQIIGKALGHQSNAATQIYSQLQLDPVRESMTTANAAMLTAMKKKPKLRSNGSA